MLQKIVRVLPREISKELSVMEDRNRKLTCVLAQSGLKRDILHQLGSYNTEFYPLETAPKVLIFADTENREPLAEEEMECVEGFFKEKGCPSEVHPNPKAEDIFTKISHACADLLSCLIVFIMFHGKDGNVRVNGEFVPVQKIIDHMWKQENLKEKPKVRSYLALQSILS